MQTWKDAALELPDELDEQASDDVLTFADGDGNKRVAFYDFEAGEWCDRYGFSVTGVTHWQLLPEDPV